MDLVSRYAKTLAPDGREPSAAPSWTKEVDNPFLHGAYAPTTEECSREVTATKGEIPPALWGSYFRNGPNPRHKPWQRYHWFDGDGMIWALNFEDGRATYTNRWIATRGYQKELEAGKAIWPGILGPFDFKREGGVLKDTANTDLFFRQGDLFATWYQSGELYAVDPHRLETRGVETFGNRLEGRISAHSKMDPHTGEFIFFDYDFKPPFMRVGILAPNGEVEIRQVELPGPRLPHDLSVSRDHIVVHDFPMVFDAKKMMATGKRQPHFDPQLPTRFGVLDRSDLQAPIRWFEAEPCYMLHVVNCYEQGDELVQVGCRTRDPRLRPDPRDGELAGMMAYLTLQANLYEWRFNLKTGAVKERSILPDNWEFPTINRQFLGRENRYAYLQDIPCEAPPTFDALVKVDLKEARYDRYPYGLGVFGSEAVFAPRHLHLDKDEDDGYLLTFTTDSRDWSSKCLIFDAKKISHGPVCEIALPHRLPCGFHALWVPGQEMVKS